MEVGRRRPEALGRSCEHRRSRGIGGALSGRISCKRNVTIPMRSSVCCAGKPTVRKAQSRSGRRTAQEANADGRKATGSRDMVVRPSLAVPHNRSDTGCPPGLKGR